MSERRFDQVRETRLNEPGAIAVAAAKRERRSVVQPDGKLFLLAADHPGRGALAVGSRPMAMADRDELLDRLCVALACPGVDGVVGTPDILEDLLLVGALERKVAIGSMNRGGIRGAVFELDDRFTCYDVHTITEMGLDGGKMLCRIAPEDPLTVSTLESCARAVTELAANQLVAMIEPFWARHVHPGDVRNEFATDSVIRSVTISSALGATSAYTWLKLPVVPEMAKVVAATTLPIVILGGDPGTSQSETLESFQRALSLSGVRGIVAGRTLLYPEGDDVIGAINEVARMLGRAGPTPYRSGSQDQHVQREGKESKE
ncbi:MAG: Cgl0159 family (beta/alpha)8-fold protein [Acidimicrobiales bacterium]